MLAAVIRSLVSLYISAQHREDCFSLNFVFLIIAISIYITNGHYFRPLLYNSEILFSMEAG